MLYLRIVLLLIAVSQLVLGALTLFTPGLFFTAIDLSAPPHDAFYLIGMLAGRFLVFGVVLVALARRPLVDPTWLLAMIGIQLIDLAVGVAYTASGTLPLGVSAFPMFNAALFTALLVIALRRNTGNAPAMA